MIVLLHGSDELGAVEHYVAQIAAGLRDAGEPATLFLPDAPALAPLTELAGGTLAVEPFPLELLDAPSFRLLRTLRSRLRVVRPRIVQVTDAWPVGLVAGRLARPRRLLVTHHTPELLRSDNAAGRLWWRLGWLTRPEVVYTSAADLAADRRRLLRRHVVPLGIDVERFRSATAAEYSGGRPVIGNVARLVEQKGHRYLIEAAPLVLERYPDAQFVIVGDGELRTELEALAEHRGVGRRFSFLGARDDVPELAAGFDVFAFPSLFEGLCLAVIEAQVAGVPVVATPVGGIRETVVPGATGVLCAPRDGASLARGILSVLDDPVGARRLAAEAERRASRYTIARTVERTLALYADQST